MSDALVQRVSRDKEWDIMEDARFITGTGRKRAQGLVFIDDLLSTHPTSWS